MNDEFNRILSEEEILPSSGFAASVMEAMRREAAAPPPIPFPWKRALPGAIFAGATLVTILVICAVQLVKVSSSTEASVTTVSAMRLLLQSQVHWVLLGLLATLVLWKFSSFMGSRRT